ncbi:MAG TPA: DUF2971 domain-containing protein [Candidatus Angelobacter sp.]|nr:DUF2971 domain-containing protein [Candidatus Angelobacter sp.]
MYETHPNLISPTDNTRLWRFMDLSKLLWLLSNSALYFCRLDLLRDPYEGVMSKMSFAGYERLLPNQTEAIKSMIISQRKWVFANSWHMNEFESAAMWDLYLNSPEGVAIETDFARFRDSFSAEKIHDVLIGKVNYIDYATESVAQGNYFNYLYVPVHKRKSFEHERELRAIVWLLATFGKQQDKIDINTYHPPPGISIQVNIKTLIRNIFVSPTAQSWYVDVVRSVLCRYGFDEIPVVQSDLYSVK